MALSTTRAGKWGGCGSEFGFGSSFSSSFSSFGGSEFGFPFEGGECCPCHCCCF